MFIEVHEWTGANLDTLKTRLINIRHIVSVTEEPALDGCAIVLDGAWMEVKESYAAVCALIQGVRR